MLVVLDTCWAQNFIDQLNYDGDTPHKDRIIVTSTGTSNKMWSANPDYYYPDGIDDDPPYAPLKGSDPNPWDQGAEFSSGFFEAFWMTNDWWTPLWANQLQQGQLPQGPPSWYPFNIGQPTYLVADTNDDGKISIFEAFLFACRLDDCNPTLPIYDELHPSGIRNPYYWNYKKRGAAQPRLWSGRDDGYDDAIDPNQTFF